MADSFFDKMFGKKAKKDEKPAPAPAPTPAPSADAANGLKFLANPKKATNKRVEDAEKAAGMKCGGKVKKMAFGGSVGAPIRPMPGPMIRPGAPPMPRPMPGQMPLPRPGPEGASPPRIGGGASGPQFEGGRIRDPGIRTDTNMPGLQTMKKGGSVRGAGCATRGHGKGKMR